MRSRASKPGSRTRASGVELALVGLGLALIGALAFQLCLLHYGRDQGIYSTFARVMLEGGTAYEDVWDFKPPGIYLIYALARATLGPSMHAIRVVEALALLSMVWAFALLSRRIAGSAIGGVLAGVILLISHLGLGFWHTAQPESFGGVLVAWALVLATQPATDGTRGRAQASAWAGCGALFTLAALLKPPLGGGVVFAFLAGAARLWQPIPGRTRRLLGLGAAFLSGVGLVLASTAAFLLATGAWEGFRYTFFEYVPHYTGVRLSWETFPARLVDVFSHWPGPLHPGVWLGVAVAVLPPRRHAREREGLFLVVGTGAAQILGIALQAKFFPYHYGAVLPLTALLSAWGYLKLASGRRARLALALAAILGLHFLATRGELLARSRDRLRALLRPELADGIHDELYSLYDMSAGANRRVARWIAGHTPADLPIYVWGFEPVIYDRSDRRPASRYLHNLAQRSAWSRRETRATLMSELAKSRPSAIVVVERDRLPGVVGNGRDSAMELERFPQLESFLRRHYVPAFSLENLTVYERRDLRSLLSRAGSRGSSPGARKRGGRPGGDSPAREGRRRDRRARNAAPGSAPE